MRSAGERGASDSEERRSTPLSLVVVLLSVDQDDLTRTCLASLEGCDPRPLAVVLWNNGENELEGFETESLQVIQEGSGKNVGVASGRNRGARAAIERFQPEYLLFTDNDCTFDPDLLGALLAPMDDPKVAITTGKILIAEREPPTVFGAGGCRIRFWLGKSDHRGNGQRDLGQFEEPGDCVASGGCLCVRSEVFTEHGGFDRSFNPYGPEDLDFCLRVKKAGLRAVYSPKAVLYHPAEPGRTFGKGEYSRSYGEVRAKRWLTFMRRWASPAEKLAFYCIGGPWLFLKVVFREARKGNGIQATAGLLSGLASHLTGHKKS